MTEYNVDSNIFRAHPNYRGEGPWYDYVLIPPFDLKGCQNHHQTSLHVPSKLFGFVFYPNKDSMMAVVHSCQHNYSEESVLTLRWRLKYKEDTVLTEIEESPYEPLESDTGLTPMYKLIPVSDILGHCLMIPYHEESKYLFQVIDPKIWGDKFNEN